MPVLPRARPLDVGGACTGTVADQLRPKDVLTCTQFAAAHRTKLRRTNPIERLNGEIKRRSGVVGIFRNEATIVRRVGAILLDQSDEWATQLSRHITLEAISAVSDTAAVRLAPPRA